MAENIKENSKGTRWMEKESSINIMKEKSDEIVIEGIWEAGVLKRNKKEEIEEREQKIEEDVRDDGEELNNEAI